MTLFRPEVIAAKQRPALGEILLTRPFSLKFFTAAAVLILAMLIGFLTWGEFTRKERLVGRIVLSQGVSKVYSPVVGTIVKKLVQEGQIVKKGQQLYVVSVERMTPKGDTQVAIGNEIMRKRDSLKAQLALQKRVFAEEEFAQKKKVADLENQLAQLQREIATQTKRLALNEASFARFRELSKSSFISSAQLAEREQEKLDQESRLQSLQRAETSLQAEIASAGSMLRNAPLNALNQLSGIERSISSAEQENFENDARREISILAPQDGMATAVLAETGQTVTPQTPTLSILPSNTSFKAYLYAPSRAIGFIAGGERVQLRYQAFPFQKFGQYGGTIQSVSRSASAPAELELLSAMPETVYRVTVVLDSQFVTAYGKKLGLQDGMLLEADVLLDKRKLHEWVLEPLYSVTGKF